MTFQPCGPATIKLLPYRRAFEAIQPFAVAFYAPSRSAWLLSRDHESFT